jgi:hypothetical protein
LGVALRTQPSARRSLGSAATISGVQTIKDVSPGAELEPALMPMLRELSRKGWERANCYCDRLACIIPATLNFSAKRVT